MAIYHIRTRTAKHKTICGAPTTIHDEDFTSRKVRPARGYVPCAQCVNQREDLRHRETEMRAMAREQLLAQ